jgi:hypothetical protein
MMKEDTSYLYLVSLYSVWSKYSRSFWVCGTKRVEMETGSAVPERLRNTALSYTYRR